MKDAKARPKVLVVDDVEANRTAIAALLETGGLGCEVVCCASGDDALRELLRSEFAAVLLDVQMPGMDGFELARLARTSPRAREVPIVFVTAMLETAESTFRGYASGAVDVLFKPINPHVLLSKVRVFLELYRSKCSLAEEILAHQRTLADLAAFNYSVSHDLRAPLRPIVGFTEVLRDEFGDRIGDEGLALLARVTAAAQRMDGIIEDLLRLAQVGRSRPEARPIDLARLASGVIEELRQTDGARRVEVVIPDTLPARGDARLLRIALENLLRNAWKFTRKSQSARIEVGCRDAAGAPAYFVADNGVGFEQAQAHRLFKAFERLHRKEEFEGSGIGLAIVEKVIHHHRGKIWVEAAPQRGATFLFTLGA